MKTKEEENARKAKWKRDKIAKNPNYAQIVRDKAKKSRRNYIKPYVEDTNKMEGYVFGMVTVISPTNNKRKWYCKCKCGVEKIIDIYSLINGLTKSCGCLKKKATIERTIKHGDAGSKEYLAWKSMKGRCYNKNSKAYPNYGGRGIRVCDRWLNSYDNFLEDMGRSPLVELSLDRIDVNGNYEKDNCRWATAEQQMNNMRTNRPITFNGFTLNISQWERKFNLKQGRFSKNRFKGWEKEKIVEFFYKLHKTA